MASPTLVQRSRAALRALGATVLFAAALTGTPAATAAQDRSVVIEDMHAVYRVQEDASISVEERFRVRFNGSWNGLERVLELALPRAYDYDEPAEFRLDGATGDGGESWETSLQRDGDRRTIRVYVPDADDRTADVVIRYTLEDALAFFRPDPDRGLGAMDELYWQITGTDWEVPILQASAEIHAPVPIADGAAYAGGVRSSDPAPLSLEGAYARVGPVGPLQPGHGLTVGVAWPEGAVQRDPRRIMDWPDGSLEERNAHGPPGPLVYLSMLFPVLALVLGYRAWDRRGRDPAERAITVQWEPPADLSPAEVGTLVDHSPGTHDLVSTLVELAVRGFIRIEEREEKQLIGTREEYVFHLIRPREEWGELQPHQRKYLEALFRKRFSLGEAVTGFFSGDDSGLRAPPRVVASVELSDLKNEFYKELTDIRNAILDQLVSKGHYVRRPDRARGIWLAGALGSLAAAFVPFFIMLNEGALISGLIVTGSALLAAVIFGIFAAIMPARTEKGARAREAALGFRRFLEKVESPRYRRMIRSPDQFEAYLPYAMAFQCEEEWARAFDDLLTEPPDWYTGPHGHFDASHFAGRMSHLASTAGTTMTSSPSSGSGGGGSVGGGGGGGGGGGF